MPCHFFLPGLSVNLSPIVVGIDVFCLFLCEGMLLFSQLLLQAWLLWLGLISVQNFWLPSLNVSRCFNYL